MDWDWLISAGILIVLALAVWARVSKQTIPELIGGIKDAIVGGSEDSVDYAQQQILRD